MKSWHETDEFWESMREKIFPEELWTSAAGEINNLVTLTGITAGAKVLDLCCGPGRHSLELARHGFQVTAVDRTRSFLESARSQAAGKQLDIDFIQDDMRHFCRPETFDAVINLYTSFGYFDDISEDKEVLSRIHTSLKKGGTAVLELMGKEILARIYTERDWYEKDGALFLAERKVAEDWNRMHNRWIILDGSGCREVNFSHRLYSGAELKRQMLDTGFSTVRLYGSLSGTGYDEKATRLVALGVK